EEQADRCDQLTDSAPRVEELRKDKEGIIESRSWKLSRRDGAPTWIMVPENGAALDGWMPKPNIAKLDFHPEIYGLLNADEPRFLAYAPSDVVKPSDSAEFETLTSAFGPGIGFFQFHGRTYSFVLVKELPCFKHEPEQ
ncbi:MAG TPA: hypothetical protein VMT58_03010, partial [Candidatus Binataceae bacterium]|nr:hypothetical protein [Candidatus Binataceae bacterium]